MSDYDTLRVKVGRRPITVVELDLDFCENVYGTSPCTALIPDTGSQKCFNTFKTCQDTANFVRGTKTYKFCTNTPFLPIGEKLLPCISDVDTAPTQLKPEGISVSASVTVTMLDFPQNDRGIDPYAAERSNGGTFFGKLKARNPYLQGRVMRLKKGYIDNDRTIYTRSETYLVDRLDPPDSNSRVRLIGKDPTKLADAEKSKVPVASKGTLAVQLVVRLNPDDPDNLEVPDAMGLAPIGVGDSYPSSGIVRIEDELIVYSGKDGDKLTGLTRGYGGTTAAIHDADEKVQICTEYSAETVPNILYDLLSTYAGINTDYLPLSDWTEEADTWLGSWVSSVLISEPTGVKEVIEEILKATGSALWWDPIDAQFKFKVIMPFLVAEDVPILDDTHNLLQGSVAIKDLEKERLSRVVTYFNLANPIDDLEKKNFRTITIQVDAERESENAYGLEQTREIVSRWTPSEAYAATVGNRLLYRYRETPKEITIRVDAKDADLKVGELRDIDSRLLQDVNGNHQIARFIVTEAREVQEGSVWEYKMLQVSQKGGFRAALWAPDSMDDWTAASDADKAQYLFFSDENGHTSDGEDAPTWC